MTVRAAPVPLASVLREFGLEGEPTLLPGGSTAVYRVGEVILKRVKETSLENDQSLELVQWIAAFSQDLPQQGFRIARPVATVHGCWLAGGGWTAWSFLAGRHAVPADIPACIEAILAYHRALRPIPAHPRMSENHTAWGLAHHGCWGEKPGHLQPELRELVDYPHPIDGKPNEP
ncbi:MAG TPA: hypothetical protein VF498_15430 [Anaerolineales bacterium]